MYNPTKASFESAGILNQIKQCLNKINKSKKKKKKKKKKKCTSVQQYSGSVDKIDGLLEVMSSILGSGHVEIETGRKINSYKF